MTVQVGDAQSSPDRAFVGCSSTSTAPFYTNGHDKEQRKDVSEYTRWALPVSETGPHRSSQSVECWVGEFINAESFCCDASQGPQGRQECWDEVYTFQSCCKTWQRQVLPTFERQSWSTSESVSPERRFEPKSSKSVSREMRQTKGRLFSLESKLRAVERSHRWFYLADTCLTRQTHRRHTELSIPGASSERVDFKLCLFGDVRFGSVNYGSFDGWDGEHGLRYSRGQHCPGGPARSLKICLLCGAETEMLRGKSAK